ncbi:MAG: PHP domain-containing protein [Candidatus Eremiobacteraeota bacterium]|nr:PHP domain-containing protein [Candidatus Eremiobacteraeota bacterium]
MLCDLHLHSSCSDGELAPAAVVEVVAAAGVSVMALADHDTVAGIPQARARARELDVRLVTGIEMTAYDGGRVVHLLGYGVDDTDRALLAANRVAGLVWAQSQERWVRKLSLDGALVSWTRDFSDAPVRLPVLIERLCRRGVGAGNAWKCYQLFVSFFAALPSSAYGALPSTAEAAGVVRGAGGVALLAHPLRLGPARILRALLPCVDGLEALYSAYTSQEQSALRATARRGDKLYSCGSDYHGFFQPAYRNPRFSMPPALAARLGVD